MIALAKSLFCYIEYNKICKGMKYDPANFDLLEIGAVLHVDDVEVKSYSRFIHPQHMELMTKERYLSFGGLKEWDLERASSIEDISRRFYKTFYEYDFLVMWNRKEYEILMNSLKRGTYLREDHKPIFLEDLIKITKGYVQSFFKELEAYGINIEDKYNLHYSKFKVKYMAQLYYAAQNIYSDFLESEKAYFLKKAEEDIIHKANCDLVNSTENWIKAGAAELFYGVTLCECCKENLKLLPDKMHIRYPLKTQFEEAQIAKMCEEFGVKYSLSENIIFIKTCCFNWRIFHNGQIVTDVYHQNLRYNYLQHKKDSFNKGFHRQNISFTNLYDVLYYIYNHDKQFLKQ